MISDATLRGGQPGVMDPTPHYMIFDTAVGGKREEGEERGAARRGERRGGGRKGEEGRGRAGIQVYFFVLLS